MGVIADATNVISEGEVQQMANAGNAEMTKHIYHAGYLSQDRQSCLKSAAELVRCLTGGDRAAMASYGKHLGMAFQIAMMCSTIRVTVT